MKILSHRGYWKEPSEKNSTAAFQRSFQLGFGVETDVRDLAGELVVSHDMPTGGELPFSEFLQLYNEYSVNRSMLALNIKADGLQKKMKQLLERYQIENYVLFDMAVPDLLVSLNSGLRCLARQSEFELSPSLYDRVCGVWMDEFVSEWITRDVIKSHLDRGKEVFVVSPELHGREHLRNWRDRFVNWDARELDGVYLCTDFPEEADLQINGSGGHD